jgi:hypothetical protein
MSERPASRSDLHRLHEVVDAEVAQAAASEDPSGVPDSALQAYEVRLRSLHDAVVAVEEHEDGPGAG